MRKRNTSMAYISDFGWLVSKLHTLFPEVGLYNQFPHL